MFHRSKKEERFKSLETASGFVVNSPVLLEASRVLLAASLNERDDQVLKTRDNHFSRFAVGAFSVETAAFEAFLNEIITSLVQLSVKIGTSIELEIVKKSIPEKYSAILDYLLKVGFLSEPVDRMEDEMELIMAVRNEFMHAYTTPHWSTKLFYELNERHLVLPENIAVYSPLCCYKLAYWICFTVNKATGQLHERSTNALQETFGVPQIIDMGTNFKIPPHIVAPDDLHIVSPATPGYE